MLFWCPPCGVPQVSSARESARHDSSIHHRKKSPIIRVKDLDYAQTVLVLWMSKEKSSHRRRCIHLNSFENNNFKNSRLQTCRQKLAARTSTTSFIIFSILPKSWRESCIFDYQLVSQTVRALFREVESYRKSKSSTMISSSWSLCINQ